MSRRRKKDSRRPKAKEDEGFRNLWNDEDFRMLIWVIVGLVAVVGVKFFTSTQMASLEHRLNTAKDDLMRVKKRHSQATEGLDSAKAQEELHVDRVKSMKGLIDDFGFRLTTGGMTEEEMREEKVRSALKEE